MGSGQSCTCKLFAYFRKHRLLVCPFNIASPALAAGKSTRQLASRNTNTSRQYYIPISISKPTSANQPSNANANSNASKAQSLYDPGHYSDAKTIYVPKNSNQLTTTSMSSTPAIVEEASRSNCARAPDVARVLFVPHLF